ncbi:MAG: hypothetical protein QW379_10415, partial [Thermoplasmata archaeon]
MGWAYENGIILDPSDIDGRYYNYEIRLLDWSIGKVQILINGVDKGTYTNSLIASTTLYPTLIATIDTCTDAEIHFDNIFVRRYITPEPSVNLGEEERPVKFKSFSVAPSLLNEGDVLELNATFENPAPDEIRIRVSLHDGESFESSREICATELPLAPQAETEVSFKWIPDGGSHTVWLALMGTPLASRTLYVNRYPVLSPIMDQVASQGKNFRLLIFAEDADGDRLNWSEDCPLFDIIPRGEQSAEINFTPTNDD